MTTRAGGQGGATLQRLLEDVRACRLCEPHLPLGPRPILRAAATARLLIVGQAPGTRVHETGIPWNDPSGELLREWLASPRPLALRAMAGIIPRSLAVGLGGGWIFWSLWLIFSGLVLVWIIRKGGLSLDRWMLWYFIVSPLVHDYDVIQLIPQIESDKARTLALILSIPLWLVILFFYNNNLAWFAVTLIAPGLLIALLFNLLQEIAIPTMLADQGCVWLLN